MSIQDLISNIKNKNYSDANDVFNSLIGEKINDALDAKKLEVAETIYNEDVEQLDELSNKLLKRYVNKADKSAVRHMNKGGSHAASAQDAEDRAWNAKSDRAYDRAKESEMKHDAKAKYHFKKADNRETGIDLARKKMKNKK